MQTVHPHRACDNGAASGMVDWRSRQRYGHPINHHH